MAVLTQKPASWANYKRNLPYGFTVITQKDAYANPDILAKAREFINRMVQKGAAIGTSENHVTNGRSVLYIVEPHYHEPNGPVKPWGWHKGATVFVGPAPVRAATSMADFRMSEMAGEFGEESTDLAAHHSGHHRAHGRKRKNKHCIQG